MKAVFLDRDGTLIADPPDERVDKPEKIQLFPDTLEALTQLASQDYAVFIITNQAGIAEGRLSESEFWRLNDRILDLLAPSGIKIRQTYLCPHDPTAHCDCRKPQPTLLLQAAQTFGIDLAASWMIGDRPSDIQAGISAGTHTILVKTARHPILVPEAEYTAPHLLDAIRHISQKNSPPVRYNH